MCQDNATALVLCVSDIEGQPQCIERPVHYGPKDNDSRAEARPHLLHVPSSSQSRMSILLTTYPKSQRPQLVFQTELLTPNQVLTTHISSDRGVRKLEATLYCMQLLLLKVFQEQVNEWSAPPSSPNWHGFRQQCLDIASQAPQRSPVCLYSCTVRTSTISQSRQRLVQAPLNMLRFTLLLLGLELLQAHDTLNKHLPLPVDVCGGCCLQEVLRNPPLNIQDVHIFGEPCERGVNLSNHLGLSTSSMSTSSPRALLKANMRAKLNWAV